MQGARRSSLHRASEARSTHGCHCGSVLGQGHKVPPSRCLGVPGSLPCPGGRRGFQGCARSPGGGKAGGQPKEWGDKAGHKLRSVGAHGGHTGTPAEAWGRLSLMPGQDRGTRAVDHRGARTQTLRHNLAVFTPEMGSCQVNACWAEPGCGGVPRDQHSSAGRAGRAAQRLPSPRHSSTTVRPLVGCGRAQGRTRARSVTPRLRQAQADGLGGPRAQRNTTAPHVGSGARAGVGGVTWRSLT